jgi:hypothetical protein
LVLGTEYRELFSGAIAMKKVLVTGLTCAALLCTVRAVERPYYMYAVHRPTGAVFAAGGPRDSKGVVARLGPTGSARARIFQGTGEVTALAIDNAFGRLGVVERLIEMPPKTGVENFRIGQAPGFERSTLHVLGQDGRNVLAIPSVRAFAWRPSGTALVIAVGKYRGPNEDAEISSVEIVSIPTGQRSAIASRGLYVSWAAFDDAAYIWDTSAPGGAKVVRYDRSKAVLETTAYHSIYFSPSGKYYYKPDGVAGTPGVFLRHTNADLTAASAVFSGVVAYTPESWAPDADVLMLTARKRDGSVARLLYNADTDNALEVRRESVFAWGANSGQLVIENEEGATLRAVDELRTSAR